MSFDSLAYDELANLNVESTLNDVKRVIEKFEEAIRYGKGDAGFMLGSLFSPENEILSNAVKVGIGASHEKSRSYFEEAFSVLMREALAGNGRSMHMIAVYYQSGLPPVSYDIAQYEHWKNKALNAGYRGAGQL
jgi:TPR repeat protein